MNKFSKYLLCLTFFSNFTIFAPKALSAAAVPRGFHTDDGSEFPKFQKARLATYFEDVRTIVPKLRENRSGGHVIRDLTLEDIKVDIDHATGELVVTEINADYNGKTHNMLKHIQLDKSYVRMPLDPKALETLETRDGCLGLNMNGTCCDLGWKRVKIHIPGIPGIMEEEDRVEILTPSTGPYKNAPKSILLNASGKVLTLDDFSLAEGGDDTASVSSRGSRSRASTVLTTGDEASTEPAEPTVLFMPEGEEEVLPDTYVNYKDGIFEVIRGYRQKVSQFGPAGANGQKVTVSGVIFY